MNKTKYILCAYDFVDKQTVHHGFESELSKEEILKQLGDLVFREGEIIEFPTKFLGLELFLTRWLDNGEIPGLTLLTLEEFWTKSCNNKMVCV